MASFTYDDGTGSQTLACAYPSPANRFRDVTPDPAYIGERAIAYGDRRRYQWIGATSERVRLTLPGIARGNEDLLRAWLKWAKGGGTFTMTTDDSEANVYTDCQLAADDDGNPLDPEVIWDPIWGEFSVACVVEHVGSPQQVLRIVYFATSSIVLNAESGTYITSGNDTNLIVGALLDAASGAYVTAGADADLTVT